MCPTKRRLIASRGEVSPRNLHARTILELRSIALVADLIIAGALKRRESRGLHYNIDYPEMDLNQARSIAIRGAGPPI